jgi:nitroreductase/NAD-dependent dihydropyrimidine dehydrogenase PreA subunit
MGVITSSGDAAGAPVIDRSTCTVCGECAGICPVEVLSMGDREIRIDPSRGFGCIACGQCMMVCPSDSISVTGRRLSPGDVMDLPAPERRATFDQVEALMRSRRSIRRFRPEAVPREAMDRVIAAAATAPMGIPPWEVGVTVFPGRDKVHELARDTADAYERLLKFFGGPAGILFRRMMKKPSRQQFDSFILPLGRMLVEGRKRGSDYVLYDAPAALLFHASPYGDGADPFIACTYAMVAAEAMGLGSCMIGCVAPVLARRKDLMSKHGVPAGHIPKIVLILGYPAVHFRKAIRRPFLSVTDR